MTNNTLFATAALSLLLSNGLPARAGGPTIGASPTLTIRLYNYAAAPVGLLSAAAKIGGQIFTRAGIETVWVICDMSPSRPTHSSCNGPADESSVYVKLLDGEMSSKLAPETTSDVFGFALPSENGFGQHATIFYHRVGEFAGRWHSRPMVLLGPVLAHEVGHLLLGHGGHERRGIMNAQWNKSELMNGKLQGLNFSKMQAERMRKQVLARMEHERAQITPHHPSQPTTGSEHNFNGSGSTAP